MLNRELDDGTLVGIIYADPGSRMLVHPMGGYVSLEHQTWNFPTRISPGGWHTTSSVDFVDADPPYVKALEKALEERRNEVKKV